MAFRRTLRSSRTALAAGAAAVLVSLTLLSGCSSSTDDDSADSADSAGGGGGGAGSDAGASSDRLAAGSNAASDSGAAAVAEAPATGDTPALQQQQVISTGHVQLRSDDVGQAVFDVQRVVDTYGGQVAQDDTESDDAGAALRSRMVLRIPTADFDEAMDDLARVATLISSERETAGVTQQVLDNDVRVQAQRRSIDRVQVLFDRATSIKDVVSVEGELSRRQADLASLEAQQRYLADQTAQSTITLSVERTPAAAPPERSDTDAGFLTGLGGGWKALTVFLVGAATVAGALLPFAVLLLVLGAPAWVVARRLRRRETGPA